MRYKVKAHDDIIHTVNSHAGFAPLHTIFEGVDGSSDAEATIIEVTYQESKNFPGTKRVVIKDNGTGFKNPKQGIPEILTQFGEKPKDVSNEKHKAFGIGTKVCLTKAVEDGGTASVESNDGSSSAKFNVVLEDDVYYFEEDNSPIRNTLNTRGTIIEVDGLKMRDSDVTILGKLTVKYYLSSKTNLGRTGKKLIFNGNEITPHDPLMRDLIDEVNDDDIAKKWTRNWKSPKYGEYEITTVCLIHSGDVPTFPDHSKVAQYLTQTPYEANDGLKRNNSGIYLARNGQYISMGDGIFGIDKKGTKRASGHNLNGTRIEVKKIKPGKDSKNNIEFCTMNKSKDQIEALYGDQDLIGLWETISEMVTESENHFKKVTHEDGHKQQPIEVIEAIVNENLSIHYGGKRGDYISLSQSDTLSDPIPKTNGVKTNGKNKVIWEIPTSWREKKTDPELKESLTENTICIHNLISK